MENFFLPAAGYRRDTNGELIAPDSAGRYWTSTQVTTQVGNQLIFESTRSVSGNAAYPWGLSIRCVR